MYNSKEILTDLQCFCPSFEGHGKYVTDYFLNNIGGKIQRGVLWGDRENKGRLSGVGRNCRDKRMTPHTTKMEGEKKIIVEAEKNHYEMRQRRGKE